MRNKEEMSTDPMVIKNITIAEMLGAVQEEWYPYNKDTKSTGIYLAMKEGFFPNGKRYCGDSMLKYHSDANWQLSTLEWIESLDLSDKHYKWEFDGKEYCNFSGFETWIERNTCSIWMNLDLDPPQRIAYSEGKDKREATFEALYQFSQYLKK